MEQDYNTLLYEKAYTEYNNFYDSLCEMSGFEAASHAYEKVIKEDILACMEDCNLDTKEAKALCKKKYPLDYVYQEWLKNDFSHMQMLEDTLSSASLTALKELKISQRDSR